jgi:5-methylcytosine-specific restriction endonuclease McrA
MFTSSASEKLPNSFRHTANGLKHLCSRCEQWLPADSEHFTTERQARFGLGGYCRPCNARTAASWRSTNPTKAAAQSARRHGRERLASGKFTADDQEVLVAEYGYKCLCCSRHQSICGQLVADHVVPISVGGSHDRANRQPLCGRCNRRKAAASVDYRPLWATSRKAA